MPASLLRTASDTARMCSQLQFVYQSTFMLVSGCIGAHFHTSPIHCGASDRKVMYMYEYIYSSDMDIQKLYSDNENN